MIYTSLSIASAAAIISTYSYSVLGKKNTYSGTELGVQDTSNVQKFPYGVIPHPIVVGNIVLFSSLMLNKEFRQSRFLMLPVLHIISYFVILLFEQFNIYFSDKVADFNHIQKYFYKTP